MEYLKKKQTKKAKLYCEQPWWRTFVIPAFGRLRLEDYHEFEAIVLCNEFQVFLVYRLRDLVSITNQNNQNKLDKVVHICNPIFRNRLRRSVAKDNRFKANMWYIGRLSQNQQHIYTHRNKPTQASLLLISYLLHE